MQGPPSRAKRLPEVANSPGFSHGDAQTRRHVGHNDKNVSIALASYDYGLFKLDS